MTDTWQYGRAPSGDVVEVGLVRGLHVALPVHFHQEDQIVLVVSGTRRFVIGDELVEVAAGDSLTVPAGTPHRSLSDSVAVCCINIYAPPGTCDGRDLLHIEPWESVRQAAHRAGMSREGFSRRFKRLQGLPPEDFRRLHRLNDARRLLRAGEPIATAAAAAGFSDQSHLGRCFRRFFGITPGRYRKGLVRDRFI